MEGGRSAESSGRKRRRVRRPRKPRVFRVPVESYVVLLLIGFGLSVAISLANRPKDVSYVQPHAFSVSDPAFLPSAHALANPSPVKGNRIELLENGDRMFPAMLDAIRAAKETVNLEIYIFWSGDVASKFRDAFIEAASRGVEVRILVDGVGSGRKLSNADQDAMRRSGCRLEMYHPVRPWMLDRFNNRTHRRILVVDGRVGFTGGAGIADVWEGDADAKEHWRDTQVRVEGPVVAEMQSAFQENWAEARGEALLGERFYPRVEPTGSAQAQVIASSGKSGTSSSKLLFATSIAAASRRIYLANSYFVPDHDAVRLFSEAARRGVDVKILVPGEINDVPMTKAAGKSGFGDLLAAGIEMYEYQGTMLHTKTMVVDGLFSTVGSTNFDNRSFRLNDEINLTVYDRDVARRLEEDFRRDLARSKRYTLAEWRNRSLKERVLEWAVRPFRSEL